MKIKIYFIISIVLESLFFIQVSGYGQDTYSSLKDGEWHNRAIWYRNNNVNDNQVPMSWASPRHHVNIDHDIMATDITAFDKVSLNHGKSLKSSGNMHISFVNDFNISDGLIIVEGNLTISNATTLTFHSGSLWVKGTLTVSNGSAIHFNASNGIIEAGSIKTEGSGGIIQINKGEVKVEHHISIHSASLIALQECVTLHAKGLETSSNHDAVLDNKGYITIENDFKARGEVLNSGTIHIGKNMIVEGGNARVKTSGALNVSGDLLVRSVGGTALLVESGSTMVSGFFEVNGGTNAEVHGYLDVGTSVTVSGGSNMMGSGIVSWGDGLQGFHIKGGSYVNGYQEITEPSPLDLSTMKTLISLELIAFEAQIVQNGIMLSWETQKELNIDFFTIERSRDAETWKVVGTVKGAGNSPDINTYNYVDKSPMYGSNHYRLKKNTFDGSQRYLSSLHIMNNFENVQVSTYPNPASEYLNIKITAEETVISSNIEVRVFDNSGKFHKTAQPEFNGDSFLLNLSTFNKGVYFLEVSSVDFKQVKRIMVL